MILGIETFGTLFWFVGVFYKIWNRFMNFVSKYNAQFKHHIFRIFLQYRRNAQFRDNKTRIAWISLQNCLGVVCLLNKTCLTISF